jgi:hypothetical protein
MSQCGALAGSPWDDNHEEEEDDEMNLFESGDGDSKMSSFFCFKKIKNLYTGA